MKRHYIPLSAHPEISWPALPDSKGTMMLALLGQFNQSQWFTPALLENRQMSQANSLIDFARQYVPYYREILPDRNKSQSSKEYFSSLPVLDRHTVQREFDSLQSNALPPEHGIRSTVTTSGSTGTPLTVTHSSMFRVFEGAGIIRQHQWHQRDFKNTLCAIQPGFRSRGLEKSPQQSPRWGWPVSEVYPTGPLHIFNISRSVDEQLLWLTEKKPDYFLSVPSNIQLLAERSIANKIELPALQSVSTTMEIVNEELRDICQRAWGVRVIDNYSCKELGNIASQCPEGSHYHVNAENLIVEILKPDGEPCAVGETGRVVVTSLRNFAMPLIRYELNDVAEVGPPCTCGRGLPVLNHVLGRVRNMLKLPTGEQFWSGAGRAEMLKLAPITQYQFIQTKLDTIELHLVAQRKITEEEEHRLIKHILSRLPYQFRIIIRQKASMPRSPAGKVEDFICNV